MSSRQSTTLYTSWLESQALLDQAHAEARSVFVDYAENCERSRKNYLASVRDDDAKLKLLKSLKANRELLAGDFKVCIEELDEAERDYTYAMERYIVDGLKLNVVARV